MDVARVHCLNPNVGVAVDDTAINVEDGAVEVEAIEIEGEQQAATLAN